MAVSGGQNCRPAHVHAPVVGFMFKHTGAAVGVLMSQYCTQPADGGADGTTGPPAGGAGYSIRIEAA